MNSKVFQRNNQRRSLHHTNWGLNRYTAGLRPLIIGVLLLVALTACSLTSNNGSDSDQTATAAASVTQIGGLASQTPTNTVTVQASSATPPATATRPAATTASTAVLPPTVATVVNCTVRADWLTYTVVTGDTLGRIAGRTNSTTNELAQANCLSNVNVITVGQVLRVPRVPATNTPTITPTFTPTSEVTYPTMNCLDPRWPRLGTDFLRIQPNQGGRPDCIEIVRDTVTTVAWPTAPTGTSQVTFYRVYDGMPRADVIGVDNVPSDGFGVTFKFASGNKDGAIWAEAIIPGQKAVNSILTGYYLVDWQPKCPTINDQNTNTPVISPATIDGRCYTIAPNSNVTVSWPGAPVDTLSMQFAALIPEGGLQIIAEDTVGLDGWTAILNYPAGTQPFMIYAIATIPHPQSGAGSDSTTAFNSGLIGVVVR